MLFEYNGKIYVKPFSNRLVEVEVSKPGNEYNVKATKKIVELTQQIKAKVSTISLEQAYKIQNKKEIKTI